MRLLINENVPLGSIRLLRDAGHFVVSASEEMAGATDQVVLARAVAENLIVLTFDRDYGEMIFREGLPVPPGVVYFRFDPATPTEPALLFLRLANDDAITLEGSFTVVERDRVRQRPLP